MLKMNREQGGAPGELRVFEGKRRGRFGPQEQVVIVIRGRETQALDFVEMGNVRLEPIPRVFDRFSKIHVQRARVALSRSGRAEARPDECDQESNDRYERR